MKFGSRPAVNQIHSHVRHVYPTGRLPEGIKLKDSNVADGQQTFLLLTLKLKIHEKRAPPELM